LGGIDIEFGKHLLSYQSLEGFIIYYHFNDSSVEVIDDIHVRGQFHINHYVTLTGEMSHDRLKATHYLNNKQDGTRISDYINGYKANYNQESWLQYPIKDLDDYHKTIWTTWELSRRQMSKDSVLLLTMNNLLSNEPIFKSLFEPEWRNRVHILAKKLLDYLLIQLNDNIKSFNMHVLLARYYN